MIHSVTIEAGHIRDDDHIQTFFYYHFKVLFVQSQPRRATLNLHFWEGEVDLSGLDRPFTEEEIKAAIWSLG